MDRAAQIEHIRSLFEAWLDEWLNRRVDPLRAKRLAQEPTEVEKLFMEAYQSHAHLEHGTFREFLRWCKEQYKPFNVPYLREFTEEDWQGDEPNLSIEIPALVHNLLGCIEVNVYSKGFKVAPLAPEGEEELNEVEEPNEEEPEGTEGTEGTNETEEEPEEEPEDVEWTLVECGLTIDEARDITVTSNTRFAGKMEIFCSVGETPELMHRQPVYTVNKQKPDERGDLEIYANGAIVFSAEEPEITPWSLLWYEPVEEVEEEELNEVEEPNGEEPEGTEGTSEPEGTEETPEEEPEEEIVLPTYYNVYVVNAERTGWALLAEATSYNELKRIETDFYNELVRIETALGELETAIAAGDAATLRSALRAIVRAVNKHNKKSNAHEDIRKSITTKIRKHNTSETAHADIREKITALLAILESDDVDLDTVQEIVDFIKNNRDVIDTISTNKLDKSTFSDFVAGLGDDLDDIQDALDEKADKEKLADVAFSGDYEDLLNKPVSGAGGDVVTYGKTFSKNDWMGDEPDLSIEVLASEHGLSARAVGVNVYEWAGQWVLVQCDVDIDDGDVTVHSATAFYGRVEILLTGTGAWEVPTVLVEEITITPTGVSVEVNATEQLSVEVLPLMATNTDVIWESLDENVATVDGTGLVTGVAAGTATIRATADDGSGVYAEEVVTVISV